MNAKEYLSQAVRLDERISSEIRQLEQLNALATKCTPTLSRMPKTSNSSTSRMEDTIMKIIMLEDEVNQSIDQLVSLKADITRAIDGMKNPNEQLLLRYRYLDNASWEDISIMLHVSVRTAHRIHGSALQNFIVPN